MTVRIHFQISLTVITIGLAFAFGAGATTTFPQEMKCAIGGKPFMYQAMMSNSSWGARPDGKPYSPSPVFPAPECPDNHLIMYRKFTADELARLKDLIASPEYTAMTGKDTQRYRMAWLEKSLVPQSEDYPWMLLAASWEAKDGSELRARYQAEFVAVVAQLPAKPDDMGWLTLQFRAANNLRELGHFAEATAVLDAMPLQKLSEGVPTDEKDLNALPEEKQIAWYFLDYIRRLRVAIAREDRSAEPLDLIPPRQAAERCFFEADELADFGTSYCQKAEIKEIIEKSKEYWEPQKVEQDKRKTQG
jgi:hypothetical protein